MTDKKMPKNAKLLFCTICDFTCCKKSNYDKHMLTRKHQNRYQILTNTYKKMPILDEVTNVFHCCCGNEYKHRQSLFNHKRKCLTVINHKVDNENEKDNDENETASNNNCTNKNDIIITLLNQNNLLQNQIIDLCKEKNNFTNINNNNINSHNKTFNLNVFLNETCKDAMNIMDFVDSLKIQLSDLENVGKLGYVEGISNIIIKNLKAMDIHKRPVHCSDSKREVMYVKDEDKWERENEEKNKIRKAIKCIANKNSRLLPTFKEKHLECIKNDSNLFDQYNKLIIESMGGSGDNDLEKEDKIIRKIAKEITINKIQD